MNQVKGKANLEIYLSSGVAIQVDDSFEEIMSMIDLNEIDSNSFIILRYRDGCRLAVRKKDIVSVAEYYEE